MEIDLKFKHEFNPETFRHLQNGKTTVMHCHHYASLFSQLAEDASDLFDGTSMLYAAAEESFYSALNKYFEEKNIQETSDRVQIAEKYWTYVGMGKLAITEYSPDSGISEMPFSHIDEAWIKKFGKHDKAINFITSGYLAAAFASIYDLPIGSFDVSETESIITGSEKSKFCIVKK